MTDQKTLIVETDLFSPDDIVIDALQLLAKTKTVDVTDATNLTEQNWDEILREVLAADKVITK